MHFAINESLEIHPDDLFDHSNLSQSIDHLNNTDLGVAARVLAEAYEDDPVFRYAMPETADRLATGIVFFTFFLRRKGPHQRMVFSTSNRSVVAVISSIGSWNRCSQQNERTLPVLIPTASPMSDYFKWIETFRPNGSHYYLEFIGTLKTNRSQGEGAFLLSTLLTAADREDVPFWTWSSNPRNLTFYHRLGFQIGDRLQRDSTTPVMIPLWRPAASLIP